MLSSDSSRLKRSQKVVFNDHVVKDQMDRKNPFTFCLISLMETGGVSAIATKHQVRVHEETDSGMFFKLRFSGSLSLIFFINFLPFCRCFFQFCSNYPFLFVSTTALMYSTCHIFMFSYKTFFCTGPTGGESDRFTGRKSYRCKPQTLFRDLLLSMDFVFVVLGLLFYCT
jgi:hypothetical protein